MARIFVPNMPPKSKLQPFSLLIRRWRSEGLSYPEIVSKLEEKGLKVKPTTIQGFCKVRKIDKHDPQHFPDSKVTPQELTQVQQELATIQQVLEEDILNPKVAASESESPKVQQELVTINRNWEQTQKELATINRNISNPATSESPKVQQELATINRNWEQTQKELATINRNIQQELASINRNWEQALEEISNLEKKENKAVISKSDVENVIRETVNIPSFTELRKFLEDAKSLSDNYAKVEKTVCNAVESTEKITHDLKKLKNSNSALTVILSLAVGALASVAVYFFLLRA